MVPDGSSCLPPFRNRFPFSSSLASDLLVAGIVYKLLDKVNRVLAVFAAAVVCPVVNTGIFLLGCQFIFLDTISEWAALYGYADATTYMFLGLAGINFLIELGVNIVLAPVIVRLIQIGKK